MVKKKFWLYFRSLNCKEIHNKVFNLPDGQKKKVCLDSLSLFLFGMECERYKKKKNGKYGWVKQKIVDV